MCPGKWNYFCLKLGQNLTNMSKEILIRKGDLRVFRTLDEASSAFGVTPGSISRAVSEGRPVEGAVMRWARRVYAVTDRLSGRVLVAVKDTRGRKFVPVDGSDPVAVRDASAVRDITVAWYFPREEW